MIESTSMTASNAPPMPAVSGETASTSAAAQARALVEARYVVSYRRPRNWDQVRRDVLDECERPAFANNPSAYYRKPIGAGVEGLGIRFVEVALRCMTNVLTESTTIFDDADKELIRVSVTDLESNTTFWSDVRVTKSVERSKPLDDGTFITKRTNSQGRATYTVPATDDDLLNKRNSLISKAIRTLGLRIIPGGIQDEAEETIKRIRMDRAAKDPDAERKAIIDAFADVNVRAIDLVAYLGHEISQTSPAELVKLRGLYGGLRDGQTTWKEIMDESGAGAAAAGAGAGGGAGGGGGSGVGDINARIAAARRGAAAASPPAAATSGPGPAYPEVMDAINKATDEQSHADALSIATQFPDQSQRRELLDAANAKAIELNLSWRHKPGA